MNTLILVLTRRCTHRCVYCPVAKTAWPDMTQETAAKALRWFLQRSGGAKVKLFGGEPLLAADVVRFIIDATAADARVTSVALTTNGAALDHRWLEYFARHPKTRLTISLDGRPEDHARVRPAVSGRTTLSPAFERLLPQLAAFPRLVVNQVVAPENAANAAAGFRYLLSLGFRRFNLMPASYVQWSSAQLESLRSSFVEIASIIRDEWGAGRPFHLRNMTVRNAYPTFTAGTLVDVDGAIFPSDCVLADLPREERESLRCGSVDTPPDQPRLADRAAAVAGVLARFWPAETLRSTALADEILDRLWRDLIRDYARYRVALRAKGRAA